MDRLKNGGQKSYSLELQVVDSNGDIICESEGFVNYNVLEG